MSGGYYFSVVFGLKIGSHNFTKVFLANNLFFSFDKVLISTQKLVKGLDLLVIILAESSKEIITSNHKQ